MSIIIFLLGVAVGLALPFFPKDLPQ